MQHRAGEAVDAGDVRLLGLAQIARREDQEPRPQRLAAGQRDQPLLGVLVPAGALDGGVEPHVAAQVVLLGDVLGVGLELGARRIQPRPVRVRFEPVRVGGGRDVNRQTGVTVDVPRATEVVLAVEDGDLLDNPGALSWMAAPIPPNPAPTMTASNCSVLTWAILRSMADAVPTRRSAVGPAALCCPRFRCCPVSLPCQPRSRFRPCGGPADAVAALVGRLSALSALSLSASFSASLSSTFSLSASLSSPDGRCRPCRCPRPRGCRRAWPRRAGARAWSRPDPGARAGPSLGGVCSTGDLLSRLSVSVSSVTTSRPSRLTGCLARRRPAWWTSSVGRYRGRDDLPLGFLALECATSPAGWSGPESSCPGRPGAPVATRRERRRIPGLSGSQVGHRNFTNGLMNGVTSVYGKPLNRKLPGTNG